MKISEARENKKISSFPAYDRKSLRCGIAHMSVGGFHRSHQACYLNRYLQTHNDDWMIHGIGNLESDLALHQTMAGQENLYGLIERSIEKDECHVIGSIKEFTHAPSNPQKVVEVLSSDGIKIISLTITEKGYCYNSEKNLDTQHPMIAHDLATDGSPVSAIGFVYEAAKSRMLHSGRPFTLMSCDNLPGNGTVASRIVLQFAEQKNKNVADWIRGNVSFPNSMVDRITPVPSKETIALAQSKFDIEDRAAVASESFIQWIIEDNFISSRPALEGVGVQFVDNVEPYEKLKVRMLNGSHSALSYISYLLGYREVDLAMNDGLIGEFVLRYMESDIVPCLPQVPGIEVSEYRDTLIERFSNPAIGDQIQRLAMDGSEKIPNAIVPPIEYHLSTGSDCTYIAFAIAGWYRYLRGTDERGRSIEIVDPQAQDMRQLANKLPHDPSKFIEIEEIFGSKVSQSAGFKEQVRVALESIDTMGMRDALTKLLRA